MVISSSGCTTQLPWSIFRSETHQEIRRCVLVQNKDRLPLPPRPRGIQRCYETSSPGPARSLHPGGIFSWHWMGRKWIYCGTSPTGPANTSTVTLCPGQEIIFDLELNMSSFTVEIWEVRRRECWCPEVAAAPAMCVVEAAGCSAVCRAGAA